MNLDGMIYKRKSVRKYETELVNEATIYKIIKFCEKLKPLYGDIKVRAEIIGKENVKCILPWIPSQVIAVFSEEKDGYLENAGFMFQQMDLYLQTLGLGSCWLGMGKLDAYAESSKDDGLKFVIMLAFGHPKEKLRSDISQFKRKSISEISDSEDKRLMPAQLAPSSVNSQPWYFTHEDEMIHVYCIKHKLFKAITLGNMNRIDMGIALAHMHVANPGKFHFFKANGVKAIKDYEYVGSFTI